MQISNSKSLQSWCEKCNFCVPSLISISSWQTLAFAWPSSDTEFNHFTSLTKFLCIPVAFVGSTPAKLIRLHPYIIRNDATFFHILDTVWVHAPLARNLSILLSEINRLQKNLNMRVSTIRFRGICFDIKHKSLLCVLRGTWNTLHNECCHVVHKVLSILDCKLHRDTP